MFRRIYKGAADTLEKKKNPLAGFSKQATHLIVDE